MGDPVDGQGGEPSASWLAAPRYARTGSADLLPIERLQRNKRWRESSTPGGVVSYYHGDVWDMLRGRDLTRAGQEAVVTLPRRLCEHQGHRLVR